METTAYESINTGRSYNICISLPLGYQDGSKTYPKLYPVIYVLDGDVMFGTAKEVVNALSLGNELEDSIVVGIGSAEDNFDKVFALREQDWVLPRPITKHLHFSY